MQIRSSFLSLAFGLFLMLASTPLLGQYFGSGDYGKERWRIGLSAGTGLVRGEVTPRFTPTTLQGELFFRRIASRVINYRFSAGFAQYAGLSGSPSDSLQYNPMLNGGQDTTIRYYDTLTGNKPFYYSYITAAIPFQAAVQINLNRAFSRLASDKNDAYLLLGAGYTIFRSSLNVKDANGTPYDFAALIGGATDAKAIREALAASMDDTYETTLLGTSDDPALIGFWRGTTTFSAALGYRRKLYSGLGIGLEVGYTFTSSDLFDNEQWEKGFSRVVGNDIVRIYNASDHLAFGRITIDLALPQK